MLRIMFTVVSYWVRAIFKNVILIFNKALTCVLIKCWFTGN